MKYSVLDMIVAESDYNTMRLNHFMQCNIDNFAYESASIIEDMNSGVITESDASILYENVFTDIINKLVAFIQKIIDAISRFFNELKIKIFGSKEEKEKLNKVKAAAKAAKEKGLKGNALTKKVKIYKIKRNKKALDAYIKEMASLERQMMKLKYQAANGSDGGSAVSKIPIIGSKLSVSNTTASTMIEYNELQKKIDACNKKYDKIVSSNAEVVELAMNDAIRFSDKELGSIALDLDEIKRGSDKVLAKFKTDAKGVTSKQQSNLIQKAVQSIETRVRKTMRDGAEFQTKNSTALVAFFTAAGIISTGKLALKGVEAVTGRDIGGEVNDVIINSGKPNGTVDKIDAYIIRKKTGDPNDEASKSAESESADDRKAKAVLSRAYANWVFRGFPKDSKFSDANLKVISSYYKNANNLEYIYDAPKVIASYTKRNPKDVMYILLGKDSANWKTITTNIINFVNKNKDFKFDVNSILKDNGYTDIDGFEKFINAYIRYSKSSS